jgi:hypothetical protein
MPNPWSLLVSIVVGIVNAWRALSEARERGRAEEIARRNAEVAEAERRAASVPEKSPEDVVRDLEEGTF